MLNPIVAQAYYKLSLIWVQVINIQHTALQQVNNITGAISYNKTA